MHPTPCIGRLVVGLIAAISTALTQSQTHDPRALWLAMKRELTSSRGEEYFKTGIQDALIPGLKGTLISATLQPGVSQLIVGLTDSETPEATLIFHNGDARVKGQPKPGTELEFTGMALEFTRDPFMLTFDVSLKGLKGLDLETAKPAPKKSPKK